MAAAAVNSRWTARRIGRAGATTLQVLCAIHLFNNHVAEIRPCTGASMYPTLSHSGSYILHSPLSLRWPFASLFGNSPSGLPARGSLVTAISPLDPSHQVLKRVIGLPGDKVCVDPTGERRRIGPAGLNAGADECVTVPKGAVWLAGDNTSNSTDSRDYGPVPLAMVKGGVVARIWPNPSWLEPTMRPVASL